MEKALTDMAKPAWLVLLGIFGTLVLLALKPTLLQTRFAPAERAENSVSAFTTPPTSAPKRSSQFAGGVVGALSEEYQEVCGNSGWGLLPRQQTSAARWYAPALYRL
jgi:hypothetical protein